MSRNHEREVEVTASREEVATVLGGVADGVLGGSVRVGDDEDAVLVDVPDEVSLEVELEVVDGDVELELELGWAAGDADGSGVAPVEEPPETGAEASPLAGATDPEDSRATFELFEDAADEWRWRLRHDNGNVIATSGEGYTRKHNARKGLRSVVENAPGAAVVEDSQE